MKIGILSQWYDPETGPAAIPGIFAREFVKAGHEVSVLTGFPNYPTGVIYEGYRQRPRSIESADGITVTRVPLHASHDKSSLGRITNYASFALSSSILAGNALKEVDAIWVYNSPGTVSLPLLAHSLGGRKPYFLHVQDLWPDSLIESGMFPTGRVGRIAAASIASLIQLTERRATTIGVISPSVKQLLLSRHPALDSGKIVYAPNPTDERIFRPVRSVDGHRPEVPWKGKFTVMYVGAVGDVQGLDTVLEAATVLVPNEKIHIAIIGDGIARERLQEISRERGLSNVTFVGRIPKEVVPLYMKSADVQLVSLGPSAFLRYTTPSKISSLLASEVPILAHISGDGARLVRDANAGIVTTPGNAAELADAISRMAVMDKHQLRGMAQQGRQYYERHLSAESSAQIILSSFKGDAESGKGH